MKIVFVITVFICGVHQNYLQNKVLFCMSWVSQSSPELRCMSTHKFPCQITVVKRPGILGQPLNKDGKNIQSN